MVNPMLSGMVLENPGDNVKAPTIRVEISGPVSGATRFGVQEPKGCEDRPHFISDNQAAIRSHSPLRRTRKIEFTVLSRHDGGGSEELRHAWFARLVPVKDVSQGQR
jgi:hypothetical protein